MVQKHRHSQCYYEPVSRRSSGSSSRSQNADHDAMIVTSSSSLSMTQSSLSLSSSSASNNNNEKDDQEKQQRHDDSNTPGLLPQYGIGNIDLTQKWFGLVQTGKVIATTTIKNPDTIVKYGIRTVTLDNNEDDGKSSSRSSSISRVACMEFVQEIRQGSDDDDDDEDDPTTTIQQIGPPLHPIVQEINVTLSSLQSSIGSSSSSSSQNQQQQYAVQYERVGPYAAQLQLVRTLRPPPSAGFAVIEAKKTTCHPPPYDSKKDSFLYGPYRLELRPLVATILPSSCDDDDDTTTTTTASINNLITGWDIYHNVSPADSRGHYLLLPTLKDTTQNNNRGQILTQNDCMDIVVLAQTINPIGSALVCYNSMGAGASQNHIHLHIWPSPPIPLLFDDNDSRPAAAAAAASNGWNCYAATKAKPISSFTLFEQQQQNKDNDNDGDQEVQLSFLDYPVCCIKLSSTSTKNLGKALGTVVEIIKENDSPHNVGLLNRPTTTSLKRQKTSSSKSDSDSKNDDGSSIVDAYVFIRSRERSPNVVPGSRAGVSEMMGVFHTSSEDQLNELTMSISSAATTFLNNNDDDDMMTQKDNTSTTTVKGPMETVLRDVSYEPRNKIWEEIKSRLLLQKSSYQ